MWDREIRLPTDGFPRRPPHGSSIAGLFALPLYGNMVALWLRCS